VRTLVALITKLYKCILIDHCLVDNNEDIFIVLGQQWSSMGFIIYASCLVQRSTCTRCMQIHCVG